MIHDNFLLTYAVKDGDKLYINLTGKDINIFAFPDKKGEVLYTWKKAPYYADWDSKKWKFSAFGTEKSDGQKNFSIFKFNKQNHPDAILSIFDKKGKKHEFPQEQENILYAVNREIFYATTRKDFIFPGEEVFYAKEVAREMTSHYSQYWVADFVSRDSKQK